MYLPRNFLRFVIPLIVIPAILPFFLHGLPQSYDAPVHLLRLGSLDYQIQHGMWYPRWMPHLLLGHGYPVLNYYAPGAYYVAEIFLLFGVNAYYAYVFAFITLILFAGWGMKLWAYDVLQSEWSAILAAAAYVYAPYLLVNTYIRGSLAEVAAQALLPWIFWSYRRLLYARQPAQYVLVAAFSLGALALSHNITLLFLPIVLIIYIITVWMLTKRTQLNLYWTMGSLALAMGISAFFWLPMIGERNQLAETAYEIAKYGWLPNNIWTWHNFLDSG